MGKASRTKRKRAAVRSAKRARNNSWWYALTALVVIAGVSLIVYSHATAPTPVGPFVADQVNANNPHNKDSHWHAALGVYDCDHWMGDQTGPGLWVWPVATPQGTPGRAGNSNAYAGLHSHADGIIHMEPATSEDAGRHATVGKYFEYGGWGLSSTSYDFLGTKVKNGDKCGNEPGTLQWAVARWDGTDPPGPQKYTVKTGNPASWKLHQGDIVVIAFLPPGKTIQSLGNPPSVAKLPGALGAENIPPAQANSRGDGAGPADDCRRDVADDGGTSLANLETVKAVVLVGGEGTRLRPLTFTTPKPLLPIANEPHLERQLAWLARHGVDEVVLSMAYLPDAFHRHFGHDHFGNDVFGDVRLRYAVEDEPLGTAGAIRYAADGIDERFVVCNGDILTSLDLAAMVRFHDECNAEATISLTEVDDPSAFGVVPTEDNGSVIAFVEKPAPGRAPSNWINAGTYVVEPAFLDRVPPRLAMSVEREIFPRMLAQPDLLFGYRSNSYWLDIGTPEKYLQAHSDALDGLLGLPPARGAREIENGVWVQGESSIHPSAKIEAPVLVGHGARIDADAHVRRSVLGPGVVVEAGVELDRAVLHDGARVSHGSRVRSSVVGIDAVLKPEVALGDDTIIGAGMTVPSGTRMSGGRVPAEGATRSS